MPDLRELVVCVVVLGIFVWLITPSRRSRGAGEASAGGGDGTAGRGATDAASNSLRVGAGTGLMGGDIEDAAVVRYAMSRTRKDPKSSDARDLGNALGMQDGLDL